MRAAGGQAAFHAHSAIVLRHTDTWVDLDMYVGRGPSEAIYRGMVGEARARTRTCAMRWPRF